MSNPARKQADWVTLPNPSHPDHNEDAGFVNERLGIAGVFDGVGGHAGSEVAAGIARDTIARGLEVQRRKERAISAEVLVNLFYAAHNKIVLASNALGSNISTTAAVAALTDKYRDGHRYVQIAWTGDSRVYSFNPDGGLTCLSLDDSYATMMAPDSLIAHRWQAELSNAQTMYELSSDIPNDAWNKRNLITASLGGSAMLCHTLRTYVRPGSLLVATTDGIHDNLTSREIETYLLGGATCEELAAAALARSVSNHSRSKPDDITVVYLPV